MDESTNPLLPAGFDIVWTVTLAVVLLLLVGALISIARSVKRLSGSQALIWTLLAVLVPVIGPVSWFAIGRRAMGSADSGGAR